MHPNIIKQVCKDLQLTYKRLAIEIGYKPDTINKSASTGKISEQLNKAIEMYLENLRLKEELKEFTIMKNTLNKILS
ncbi:MAG: transcriptional regulator [Arcobacter sp.]|nr:MAG: transcriptional regulator [Arcobacter sp.]